ncbi:hypothetical protein GS439_12455 [Rhodococcus hoagii]|nr:hypothetical protein [Prescottella equi]NKZ70541.1 hypothetical protein [Prescottella equi]
MRRAPGRLGWIEAADEAAMNDADQRSVCTAPGPVPSGSSRFFVLWVRARRHREQRKFSFPEQKESAMSASKSTDPVHDRRFDDAVHALSILTHRPTKIVCFQSESAVRVDFAFRRHVLATHSFDAAGEDSWQVQFRDHRHDPECVLARAQRFWLIDAFDAVITELDRTDQWVESDARLAGLRAGAA